MGDGPGSGGGEVTSIEFNDIGELASPVAIAGFEGWNDAGEAASGVVNHLGIAWQATPIGAIDPEDFYDFQVNRPVVEIESGQTQRLIWPTTRISLARAQPPHAPDAGPEISTAPPTGLSRDVVLVHGIEPNMRWRAFSEELVQGLQSLGVELIILLGALLADAPHTRPVPVSVGVLECHAGYRDRHRAGRLQGPHRDRRGDAARLRQRRDPDHLAVGAGAALRGPAAEPEGHAGAAPRRGGHPGRAAAAGRPARGGTRLGARRGRARPAGSEVAEYVRTLEEAKDAMDLPEASGDAIAREFERYFRRNGGAGEPGI